MDRLISSTPEDLKTPVDWHLDGVDFLSIDTQKTLKYGILKHLPNNHYGYVTETSSRDNQPTLHAQYKL